ncbi:MAG: magnetosome biogenesis CDF transporter MamM [Nitrospirota bacterium]|nr:magnetosome biogenesis CDF transporter MamM [Nitrospirota bacterium]
MSHDIALTNETSGEFSDCTSCEKRAVWVSVLLNLALTIFKAVIGVFSGSKAVLGDALYSLKDFVASLAVLIGVRVSNKPADKNHPYGHGKIEYVVVFLISILIIGASVFLFVHSVKNLWLAFDGHHMSPPKFIAFFAAIISVIANYKLSGYLRCVGTRLKSPAILASAEHNHSDATSSILVAGAILGARFGFYFLDPLAAAIETVDLLRLSVNMLNHSLTGMLDSSESADVKEEIRTVAALVPGVRGIPMLKSRRVGQNKWIDIIIKVDQDRSVEEGHRIGLHVEQTLKKAIGNIAGITLSVEPEVK